jgi:hypothetical protein
MHLHIERQDMTAQIRQDPMLNEDMPESLTIVRCDVALAGTGKAIHRMDRMVPQDQLVTRISTVPQGLVKPRGLDPAFPTEPRPHG